MTDLHAWVDWLEGELTHTPAGAAAGLRMRAFSVLRLTRSDGTTGMGEASPLPGYSPDSLDEAVAELQHLVEAPVDADPLASPHEVLRAAFAAHPMHQPSSCFAMETALLDWLSHTRGKPLHDTLAGRAARRPVPVADLVLEADAAQWPSRVDALVADGATHIKLKIGLDMHTEVSALEVIRRAHPALPLRLDANRRVSVEALRRHAASLEALRLELLEEPVAPHDWFAVSDLPLPFALDETLRDPALTQRLLDEESIRAVVLKPTVLGGFRPSLEIAERAVAHGAQPVVSHTFEGPIARAATAELALALQTELAAGLGAHPALDLWPPHRIAAIAGRQIIPHDMPGLGLRFEEDVHA